MHLKLPEVEKEIFDELHIYYRVVENASGDLDVPTKAKRLRTFGAASRSRVGRTGPSSRSFVRAAGDADETVAEANEAGRTDAL